MTRRRVLTHAERVGEYLKIKGYNIGRIDIYGMTRKGYYEFSVKPNGEFVETFNRKTKEFERVRTFRAWKKPEHGEFVEKELK